MGHVFGDSTPFPFDANYIEIVRHAVQSGVVLLKSQATIDVAVEKLAAIEQERLEERTRLEAMSKAVVDAMAGFTASTDARRPTYGFGKNRLN